MKTLLSLLGALAEFLLKLLFGLVTLCGIYLADFALNVVFGIVAGWLTGLFIGNTVLGILAAAGIKGFAMWQIGAVLGFIAAFFKCSAKIRFPQAFRKPQEKKPAAQNSKEEWIDGFGV